MNRRVLAIVVAVIATATSGTLSAEVSAADFLSPARGGSDAVLASVVEQKDPIAATTALVAESAQDGFNAAVRDGKEGLVRFPSGFGFIVSGEAAYQIFPNPDATLISKRLAYVKAYETAKKELSRTLNGFSTKSMTSLMEDTEIETTAEATRTRMDTDYESSVRQFVEGLLRGFVIYETEENSEDQMIRVSLVTTPRTRSATKRLNASVIEAEKLSEAMEEILAEIRAGVVPPVGGRIISVRSSRETALVGFGSEVVRHSDSPAIRARMKTVSLNSALMNATGALCALMTGEKQSWSGSQSDVVKERYRDFAETGDGDPLRSADMQSQAESLRSSFVSTFKQREEYRSATEGRLPPGTIKKQWVSDDGNWAFCVAVFAPSMKVMADMAREDMLNGAGPISGGGSNVPGPRTGRVHKDDGL